MKLLVTLEPDETGMLVAEYPAIPGCISQGRTEAEALDNIREAIAGCLETRAAHGMPPTIGVREMASLSIPQHRELGPGTLRLLVL